MEFLAIKSLTLFQVSRDPICVLGQILRKPTLGCSKNNLVNLNPLFNVPFMDLLLIILNFEF